MTLEGILVGLFALAIGLGIAFYGFKIFLILLPIWGFFAGFAIGAGAMTYIFGDGFLAVTSSWVVGFLAGLLFAVLSYLYYWGAVGLLGGVIGYQLTVSVLTWIGFSADGWLVFLLALIVGGIVAVAFIISGMPAVLAIVATALLGAGAAISGILIALGIIPLATLNGGIYGAFKTHDLGLLWLIAGIALAAAGAIFQARQTSDMSGRISEDMYRNPGIDKTPTGASPA